MKLEELVKDQTERHRKTGLGHISGCSESWTWRMYIQEEIGETCTLIASPKSCLENAKIEWENVKIQGCTKMEIIQDSSERIVHIFN